MRKRVAFCTLGCKVNQYETEAIEELFSNDGYIIVPFGEVADIYVINTCSVTNTGDKKSRQMIRRAKKTNPNSIVIVTGCFAQTASEDVLNLPEVNLVIGTKERQNIVEIANSLTSDSKINLVRDIMHNHKFEELKISKYSNRTRAFIKIQEGCNQFCSYCIIPYARGPIRSRQPQEVIAEVKELTENGFEEVILVGIHVASYGLDLKSANLEELLMEVDKIEGVKRIRLSSIEPMTLNTAFLDRVSDSKKLCHHFHISLQSGCDETLKRMNRKYTTSQYTEIVNGLRSKFPDVAITTDIMVGFPGETEDEFNQTLEFVRKIEFAEAHIFQYSPRKGTPAAKYPNQISSKIKEQRSKILINECKKSKNNFLNKFIGKEVTVLFEQRTKDGMMEGKTDNYITVHVPYEDNLEGMFKNVLLKEVSNNIVIGQVV